MVGCERGTISPLEKTDSVSPIPIARFFHQVAQRLDQTPNVRWGNRLLINKNHASVLTSFFCPVLEQRRNRSTVVCDKGQLLNRGFSRQAESSWPRKLPSSHSTMPWTMIFLSRRRMPAATRGEMCSSRRSLSISAFRGFSCREFDGLRQHPLQRCKIRCAIFVQRLIDLVRKCLGVAHRGLHLSFRPSQVLGCGCQVIPIALDQEHNLPDSKTAALDACLPASG